MALHVRRLQRRRRDDLSRAGRCARLEARRAHVAKHRERRANGSEMALQGNAWLRAHHRGQSQATDAVLEPARLGHALACERGASAFTADRSARELVSELM